MPESLQRADQCKFLAEYLMNDDARVLCASGTRLAPTEVAYGDVRVRSTEQSVRH